MTRNEPQPLDRPAIVFAILLPTVVTLIYFVLLAKAPAAIQQSAYAIGKTIQFAFPIVYALCFRRHMLSRKTNATGTTKSSWWLGVMFGCLVVVSMFVAWYGFLSGTEIAASLVAAVNEKVNGLGLDSPAKFLALGIFYAIGHSFLEEYYWRWFVFDRLKSMTSDLNANVISSFGFAAHHVILLATFFGWSSPLTWLCSLGVAVGGIVWAWLYHCSDRLAIPWISHLIVDAGIFGLGYLIVFGTQ